MNLYTSYYDNICNIISKVPDMQFVSIAGYPPKDCFNYHCYKKLAPKKYWWDKWYSMFDDKLQSNESIIYYTLMYYSTVLQNLNVNEVYSDLMYIKNDKQQCNNVCLLCYEKPDLFCHRQIVKTWFNTLGYLCKEF